MVVLILILVKIWLNEYYNIIKTSKLKKHQNQNIHF